MFITFFDLCAFFPKLSSVLSKVRVKFWVPYYNMKLFG